MLSHNFIILDKSIEECDTVIHQYWHDRIPNEFIASVEDDIIVELLDDFSLMITSPENSKVKFFGLDYTGITIIPPDSLSYFQDIFLKKKLAGKSSGVCDLIAMISRAIAENKSIVHYGI